MTPAEQGQERWTIRQIGKNEDGSPQLIVDGPDYKSGGWREQIDDWPSIEVVPASELEMCQRYFPFMRRSRDEAVRKLSACQEELAQAMQIIRGEGIGESLLAAEAARDEAVKREKVLRAAIEEHRDRDTFKSTKAEANRKLYAALDQSGKEARR